MPHFDVPSGSHSKGTDGSTFKWNTTDGPGTTSYYKFQVGTQPGYYDIYNGGSTWYTGGAAGKYNAPVSNLRGDGGTYYVRALYKKPGSAQIYYTTSYPFGSRDLP